MVVVSCGSDTADVRRSPGDGGPASGGASQTEGGAAGDGSPRSGAPTRASACVEYVLARCARLAECTGQTLDCVGRSLQCPDVLFSDGSQRTVAGVIACAEAWTTFSCDLAQVADEPDCDTPGTRADGEPCIAPSQCRSLNCSIGPCGKCTTLGGPGEACAADFDCAGGYDCIGGTCQTAPLRLAQPGQPCSSTNGRACVPGSLCTKVGDAGAEVCVALPSVGEPCLAGQCQPSTSFCNLEKICQALPLPGEPCSVPGASPNCAAGALCDKRTHTCPALPGAGQSCGGVCAPSLACVCTGMEPAVEVLLAACATGTCMAVRNPGEACDAPNSVCAASKCTAGVCVAVDSQGLLEKTCKP